MGTEEAPISNEFPIPIEGISAHMDQLSERAKIVAQSKMVSDYILALKQITLQETFTRGIRTGLGKVGAWTDRITGQEEQLPPEIYFSHTFSPKLSQAHDALDQELHTQQIFDNGTTWTEGERGKIVRWVAALVVNQLLVAKLQVKNQQVEMFINQMAKEILGGNADKTQKIDRMKIDKNWINQSADLLGKKDDRIAFLSKYVNDPQLAA